MNFLAPIVGMAFRPPAGAVLSALPFSTPLLLRRQPSNEYDSNAVQVLLEGFTPDGAFAAEFDACLSLAIDDEAEALPWPMAQKCPHQSPPPRLRQGQRRTSSTDRRDNGRKWSHLTPCQALCHRDRSTSSRVQAMNEQAIISARLQPTSEQRAILSAARSSNTSLLIEAMAGCSKTSTIEILIRSLPVKPTAYIVFNKRNQIEAEKTFRSTSSKWSHLGSATHANVLTLNSLGHRAWSQATGKRLTLNTKKLLEIVKQGKWRLDKEGFSSILSLVRRARISGLIPSCYNKPGLLPDTEESWKSIAEAIWIEPNEDLFYYAQQTLIESIRQSFAGLIDYDDQIYMSALFGGVFPRYPVLFGDEVQDYSPLNKIQIQRAAADRLILVGDPRQAIYAFRGADSDSMNSLQELRSAWQKLPLSVTFRCPKAIVARQQQHAAGFAAFEKNSEGSVENWLGREWSTKQLPSDSIAILCRNNAPLLSAAIRCIKSGRGARVLGGEIGKGLVSLAKKLIPSGTNSTLDAIRLVSEWATSESSKCLANSQEEKVSLIYDKAECLYAVLEQSTSIAGAISLLERLFADSACTITCSTGHKAKGLEWSTVVHLDPWRIPSKLCTKARKA